VKSNIGKDHHQHTSFYDPSLETTDYLVEENRRLCVI